MEISEKTVNTLVDAVRQVTSSLNLGQVLDTILDTLKELIDYQAAVVCVVDSKTRAVRDLKSRGYPPHPADRNFLEPGAGIIGWVVENAQGQIVRDVKGDTRYVKARSETLSEIAAPIIRTDGEVIGAINLEADKADWYGPDHLELLTMFASLAASAINNTLLYREVLHSRRVESELELARTVVESLLPRAFPLIEGFDIYGSTIPVRQVGGDYFDFISSISYRLAVLVADVSGKGLPAALVMVSFRAYLLATIINDLSMRVVMSRVNKLVYDSTAGDRFITTFYGLIDPEHKRLLYINAGHNPPLLLHADGTSELLEDGGLPLGVFSDARYSESVVNFRPGDILVLYTDGVTDARDGKEESFGLERLQRTVRAAAERRAHEICDAVTTAVRAHSVDVGGLEDDLTVSVIKVK